MRAALRKLKEQGMQGLILDLRFNPGGLLQSAVEISDMFVDSGLIVSTEGRNVPSQKWSAKSFGTYKDFPMAVLVNHYSASASEIVSACLQDHDRAVVIGERTWGKGSVQNVSELEGGLAALKLTTAAYHRPSGKNIHRYEDAKESDEWGVMPNDGYEVKYSNQENIEYQLYRRQRDLPEGIEPEKISFDDRQLSKAVEYLRGKIAESSEPAVEAPAANAAEKPAEQPAAAGQKDAADLPLPLIPFRRAFHG
jgi:carboxyl-terminal processing protease